MHVEANTEEVKRALERLLTWPEIARSPQLANFLSYIVERRLGGDAQSIKAYSIAVDVFGRPADFDPQADPIVRVQARRLRGLLDQYYRGPGIDEPLRIQLPIGRYVPDFIDSATEPSARPIGREPSVVVGAPPPPQAHARPKPKGHITVSWFVLLVLALGAAALAYSIATLAGRQEQMLAETGAMQRPRLKIMEFQNLTGDSSLTPSIAALAVELVTDFEPMVLVDAAFGGRGTIGVDASREDDFILTGVVRDAPADDGYEFHAIVTDVEVGQVIWNWSGTVPRDEITDREGIDYVSRELILRLGGPLGPLHAKARDLLARTDISGQENLYLCGILFAVYRAMPNNGTLARLDACIKALSEATQADGNVIAARASVLAETMPGGLWNGTEQLQRYAQASQMLMEALEKVPTSSFAWEQQARLYEAIGEHDDAQSAYSTALQLNTANVDGTAASARHLALTGHLDRALPLSRRAIDAVSPIILPGWFNCVPALSALADNTFIRARRLAEQCADGDPELGSIFLLLAAAGANDVGTQGQTLPSILEIATFRSAGIMTRLHRRITDQALLTQIEDVLRTAGVPERNLRTGY